MRRFRPSRHGGKVIDDSSSNESSLRKNVNRVVKKGGHDMLKIDVGELNTLVSRLRQNSHLYVKSLPRDVGRDFRQLLTYVSLLHDTKQYLILHNIVSSHFRDVKDIVPGTIGAYCAGCSVDTSFQGDIQGCSAVCAGSMPPKDNDWSFCKNIVVLASFRDEHFYFTISKRGETHESRETAFIFVDFPNRRHFPGFTEDEKSQLKKLGIKNVYLNGYGKDGRKYSGIENRMVSIDEIKTRDYPEDSITKNDNNFSESGLIVFTIVIILLLLFFVWRSRQI